MVAERGYAKVTSAAVARRAAVSSSAFYKHFDDLAACVIATYELAGDCLHGAVAAACEDRGAEGEARGTYTDEAGALREGIEAGLHFVRAEPALAKLLGPSAPWALSDVVDARQRLQSQLAVLAQSDRLAVAGALGFVGQRLRSGETDNAGQLAAELAELMGGGASRSAVACPRSPPRTPPPPPGTGPGPGR